MDPAPRADNLVGRTFGHYRILQHLGAGGMGEVFRARDERLHRDVAIKLLGRGVLADPRARRQFRSEALTLSRINHPNVETVFDFDTFDDLDALVLELVPGITLNDRIRSAPLPEREIVRLGTQMAAGLNALHERGVVHRDLKPANLRVTPDGRLKILDLGLATLTSGALMSLETQTGFAVPDASAGTPLYMAPEQIRGGPVDARTDIHAAGAVLYEMSTGRPPFKASGLLELAADILQASPAPPRSANPAISPDLERIIVKALDKDPDLRYQSARELLVDLERLSSSSPGGVHPAVPAAPSPAARTGVRTWLLAGRRPSLYVALGLLVAAVAAIAWWTTHPPRPGRPFAARGWVLVADFANTGTPTALEQTLREALTVALGQSRYVNVLPRERVVAALRRMSRPPEARVDRAVALDLGRREGVAVLLAGTLAPIPGGTRASVEAVNVADGRTLFVEHEEIAAGRTLQSHVDDLAARVRRELGESIEQVQKSRPLAEATTASLEALERYSRGADQFARGNLEEAGLSLRAAVALDPGFAAAHELLARVYQGLGDTSNERDHLEEAWKLRARLTDRERLVIEAAYASLHGDYEQGVESLQTLVGLYPDDAAARYELGVALNYAGHEEAAIGQFRQALQIDRHFLRARGVLMLVLMEANQPGEALRVFEEAKTAGLVTPDLEWGRALALFGADRIDEARQAMTTIVARAAEPYKLYAEVYLDRVLIYTGQFAAARASLEAGVLADQQAKRWYPERLRRYLLGRLDAMDGNTAGAKREARAILGEAGEAGDLRVEHVYYAGILYVLGGDVAGAERALARLRVLIGSASGFARSCELHLKGEIDRARGRVPQAIEEFRAAAAAYPNYLPHQSLAALYGAGRRRQEATAEWEAVAGARGDVLRNGFAADWVLAEARLARLYAEAGDSNRAQASCARLVAAWAHADDGAIRRDALVPCGPTATGSH